MKRKFTFFLVLSAIMLLGGCEKAKNDFPNPSGEPPVLVVRSTIGMENTAGSKIVDIATNSADWLATVEEVEGENHDWIKLLPTLTTPGLLEVVVTENSIMDERVANVIITAGGLSRTLRVVQFGTTKKILFSQGASKTVVGKGETFDLEIVTNCPTFEWQIEEGGEWIKDITLPSTSSKAFEDKKYTHTFTAEVNPLEVARRAKIFVYGTDLGLGATAEIVVEQSVNVVMSNIPAAFVNYDGKGTDMAKIFDGNFTTFGETSYQTADGGDKRILDIAVKADKLFQIQYYPRNYNPAVTPIKLGNVNQYPADLELWVKTSTKDWEKVSDVQIRGTGKQGASKKYPDLIASEVPYYIYDGASLSDVRMVRFVITSGNSATGENNQFWGSSEIQFKGVAATIVEPVKATIKSAAYSWVSSDVGVPEDDGGSVALLHDGIIKADNYWQTPYFDVTAEDAEAVGKVGSTADAVANGTTITLNLDKLYSNVSELRYYIRNNTAQAPKVFEIWADKKGNGRYEKLQEFTDLKYVALPGFTSIKLDEAVTAKSIQIYVKETSATENKMFMAASEIEVYTQP